MNSTALTVFIAITAVAVVLQMAILLALYLGVRRTSAQMESIALDFQRRSTPIIENARDVLADATPKLKEITANLTTVSASLKENSEALGSAAVEIAMRARNKVATADEMISRTFERVEKTTDAVQNGVLNPVRHVQGIMQAVSVGIGAFLSPKRQPHNDRPRGTGDDEMFI
ncbi:MAG TPA: hypothetical protein VFQ00_09975 [Terriglobales bacterium]|nr:hypothetical protein [Terriglobales bacterium]